MRLNFLERISLSAIAAPTDSTVPKTMFRRFSTKVLRSVCKKKVLVK